MSRCDELREREHKLIDSLVEALEGSKFVELIGEAEELIDDMYWTIQEKEEEIEDLESVIEDLKYSSRRW